MTMAWENLGLGIAAVADWRTICDSPETQLNQLVWFAAETTSARSTLSAPHRAVWKPQFRDDVVWELYVRSNWTGGLFLPKK